MSELISPQYEELDDSDFGLRLDQIFERIDDLNAAKNGEPGLARRLKIVKSRALIVAETVKLIPHAPEIFKAFKDPQDLN
jgi:hypothetical protein